MLRITTAVLCLLPLAAPGAPMYTIQNLGATAANTLVIGLGLSSNGSYATGSQNPSWTWSSGSGINSLTTSTGIDWQEARGVNSFGQVVGYSYGSSPGGQQALLWDGSTLQSFLPTGATSAQAWGINDAGIVVGTATIAGVNRVFVWDPSTSNYTLLSGNASALAISSNGTIAGWSPVSGSDQASRITGGLSGLTSTVLDDPAGASYTRGASVNDSGVVVGFGSINGVTSAIQWTGTTAAVLPVLLANASGSYAYGINNGGDVVGSSGNLAALWRGGQVYGLNDLLVNPIIGLNLVHANAVSDNGTILATGLLNGRYRAFLLTPAQEVPEPSTMALTAAAGLLLLRLQSRRNTKPHADINAANIAASTPSVKP